MTASQTLMERTKRRHDRLYAAGKPEITDREYDAFVRRLRKLFPDSAALTDVGGDEPRRTAGRVKLPILVGSLDLCRPAELAAWMRGLERESGKKQVGWLVEPKLDGASLTLRYADAELDAAWSRGKVVDGDSMGYLVTDTARLIQGVLKRLRPSTAIDVTQEYLVRGEVVMHGSIFREHYANRESGLGKTYATARNMVAGLINRIDPESARVDLGRCTFVALHLFRKNARGAWVRPHDAHKEWVFLTLMGFTTSVNPVRYSAGHRAIFKMVREGHEALRDRLPVHELGGSLGGLCYWDRAPTAEQVVERMNAIHRMVDVRCDGLVVQPIENGFWQKRGDQLTRHPSFMRAVKLDAGDQDSVDGVVGSIEWNVSKRGMLKPRLILRDSLNFEGVSVDHCTCNNAAWVAKWGLRPGRHIRMVRSGDVIPRIVAVFDKKTWHPLTLRVNETKSSRATGAVRTTKTVDGPGIADPHAAKSLPTRCPSCRSRLRWTRSGVDLVCENDACPARHGRSVLSFFRTLGVDDVAAATVEHLMAAGMDSVAAIMRGATPERLASLEKYGDRKARIVSDAVAGAMRGQPLARVMHASGCFAEDSHSLGSTRLQAIVDAAGEGMVRRGTARELRTKLAPLHGLGARSLDLFLDALPEFRKFYAPIARHHTTPSGPKTLAGQVIAYTGFRPTAEQQRFIEAHGGRVAGMSGKVTVLMAASLGSAKCKRADDLKIPVIAESDHWKWIKNQAGEK